LQRSSLRLDGYPTLFFDVHRVKNLRTHLPILQAAAALDEPVCERGFAVINMRNDRKISDVIHQRERLSACLYCEEIAGHLQWSRKKGASRSDAP
jgi:hypothetical protein